jgi:alpha-L-fucosidase
MLKFIRLNIAVLVMATFLSGFVTAGSAWPYADETKSQRDERMQWWREARFGMFIHWGVYAVPAGTYKDRQSGHIGEWIMSDMKIPVREYRDFAGEFNPVKYDPDAWVRLAKEAGMKYIVITSKHHDGFALFDSKVTDWDVVDATPYGQDLLKPLAEACGRHGLRLGFYYSQAQDWCHPGGGICRSGGAWDTAQAGSMENYVKNIAVPQVQEILSNYGDIAVLWWDTPCEMNKELAGLFEPVVSQVPGIITNNRLGGGYAGDTETPEQYIPATGFKDRDWETCMTINDTWGYKSFDQNWKSAQVLIRNLIDIASKGGNYLLNVGPTAEGEIPQISIDRLKEIGQWMNVNGEAIYGTTASPFANLGWGRCTKKERADSTTLYFHIFDWPSNGSLIIPGLKNSIARARLLATAESLKTQPSDEGVRVMLRGDCPDAIATVIAVEIEGPLMIEKVYPEQQADGRIVLPAEMADIHNRMGSGTQVETKAGQANIGYWTDDQSRVQWQFRADRPGHFTLRADVASVSDSSAEISVAGKTLAAKIVSTGSYEQFRMQEIGTVEIGQRGVHSLEIRPVRGSWQPVNIRRIELVRIKGN